MKINILFITTLAALLVPPLSAVAADNHNPHGNHAAMAAGQGAMSNGTIKKVDHKKSRLTIAHGPLANLGMPPMTMAFKVGQAGMLDAVKPGDQVMFFAEDIAGVYTVTQIEVIK